MLHQLKDYKIHGLIVVIFAFCFVFFQSTFVFAFSTPEGFNTNISSKLQYSILDWNENQPLQWWSPSFTYRGDVYTNVSATMMFDLSDFGPNDALSVVVKEPIPYFDVNITDINGNVNFSVANVSSSEIAIALSLGYMAFQPGLIIRVNMWEELAELAFNQSSVERSWDPGVYDNATVEVINNTIRGTVTYKFNQTTGFHQQTELEYSKTTGILLYAKTSVGNYRLEFRLFSDTIAGYNEIITLGISIITITGIAFSLFKKSTNSKNMK
ncbi:MAG: hypothetical protein ACTSRZ_03520 [Promethearchaeota archaeon]